MKGVKLVDNIMRTINISNEQIETVVKNFCALRHFSKYDKIFDGKPLRSNDAKNVIKKYNLRNLELNMMADRYIIYKMDQLEDVNNAEILKYNKTLTLKNYKPRTEILIIIHEKTFNKQHFLALPKLFYLFEESIAEMAKNNPDECYITIMPTYQISEKISSHLDNQTFPFNYRVISIIDAFPLLGSKQGIKKFGFTRYYDVCKYQPYENGKDYAMVYDDDIMIKLINAMVGDIVCCQVMINDSSPYYEWQFRRVHPMLHDTNTGDASGLFMVQKNVTYNFNEDE
jgi:hypothetical protein